MAQNTKQVRVKNSAGQVVYPQTITDAIADVAANKTLATRLTDIDAEISTAKSSASTAASDASKAKTDAASAVATANSANTLANNAATQAKNANDALEACVRYESQADVSGETSSTADTILGNKTKTV